MATFFHSPGPHRTVTGSKSWAKYSGSSRLTLSGSTGIQGCYVFFVSSYFFPPLLGLPLQSNLNGYNCGIRDILQILGLVKMFIWVFCKMLGKTWMNFWAHPILLCTDISDLKYTHPWLTSICKHSAQWLIPQRTLLRSFPRKYFHTNKRQLGPRLWLGGEKCAWKRLNSLFSFSTLFLCSLSWPNSA